MSDNSASSVKRILVLVFGATTGATLYEFKVGLGFRLVWNKDIPWIMDNQVYIWPMEWLRRILSEVKAMATPGTIIAPAMWGADVVHMSDGDVSGPVLHYRSVPPEFANNMMATTGIPKHQWSNLMGHVHPEFYQMAFQGAFWREYTHNEGCLQVVPLADWMTAALSGQKGHDPVMLHNQGAGVPISKLVNRFFDRTGLSEFAPIWRVFASDELLQLPNNVYVVPCTHDSALARLMLASTGLRWGLWTGSWYGVYRAIEKGDLITPPGENTYSAGLVFEAMPNNGMSAISNIGMHGPLYKALKNANGAISYDEAARLALTNLPRVTRQALVFSDEILKQKPDEAWAKANGDLGLALAMMANTIATSSKNGLTAAASALGVPCPSEVAIVGGFAENRAILEALRTHGICPNVPPFAGMATQAGMAAQALCLSGAAPTIDIALKMLPNVALAD